MSEPGPVAVIVRRCVLVLLIIAIIGFVRKCDEENFRPWPQPSQESTR
jgi:hypothetical protein